MHHNAEYWNQVLSKKLRSERPEEEREAVKIVAVDLQVPIMMWSYWQWPPCIDHYRNNPQEYWYFLAEKNCASVVLFDGRPWHPCLGFSSCKGTSPSWPLLTSTFKWKQMPRIKSAHVEAFVEYIYFLISGLLSSGLWKWLMAELIWLCVTGHLMLLAYMILTNTSRLHFNAIYRAPEHYFSPRHNCYWPPWTSALMCFALEARSLLRFSEGKMSACCTGDRHSNSVIVYDS